MTTLAQLLDDLNDRIDDPADAQVPEANKIRYINHGLNAMWPRIYKTVADTSIVVDPKVHEYPLPALVGDNSMLTRVDIETDAGSGVWTPVDDYEILPVQTGRSIIIERPFVNAGATLRVIAAKRLALLGESPEVDMSTETPVLGLAANNRVLWTGHGLAENDRVVFTTLVGGAGLAQDVWYYVRPVIDADNFALSVTRDGPTINWTSNIGAASRMAKIDEGFDDVYEGPPGTEEIPVWYALGLVMGRRHENRLDYTRYTTVAAENGVDIAEVMSSSQFCFAQFELLLERAAMPMPSRAG